MKQVLSIMIFIFFFTTDWRLSPFTLVLIGVGIVDVPIVFKALTYSQLLHLFFKFYIELNTNLSWTIAPIIFCWVFIF